MTKQPKAVKIKIAPSGAQCSLYDAETGEKVPYVKKAVITLDAREATIAEIIRYVMDPENPKKLFISPERRELVTETFTATVLGEKDPGIPEDIKAQLIEIKENASVLVLSPKEGCEPFSREAVKQLYEDLCSQNLPVENLVLVALPDETEFELHRGLDFLKGFLPRMGLNETVTSDVLAIIDNSLKKGKDN